MSNVIDPHHVFENLRNVQLEDLSIYVELSVTKRTRLTNTTFNDQTNVVNFMGYADNKGTFTTNWTENEENFGIRSVNISMNASYVPQIDIEFEDVRGQALFSKKGKSQYEALLMMPPPIFDLKVKGYYGQMISYRLHLIKQNTKYVNGSYVITANFVGMTFAPLADILVDYIQVAPYLRGNENGSSFLNFIYESKKLVNSIKVGVSPNEDKIKLLNDEIRELNNLISLGEPFSNIKTNIDSVINNGYSAIAKSVLSEGLTAVSPTTIKIYFNKFSATEDIYNRFVDGIESVISTYTESLDSNYIEVSKTPNYTSLDNFINSSDRDDNFYVVTTINFKLGKEGTLKSLNKKIADKQAEIKKLNDYVNDYKNDMVTQSGIDPSLRSVLSIILVNAKEFYSVMKELVSNVESLNRSGQAGQGGEDARYAFPEFYENKNINGQSLLVKTIPNGGQYDTWDEVRFVNEYIEAKRKSSLYVEENIRNFNITNGRLGKYVPLAPYDNGIYFKNLNLTNFINDIYSRGIYLYSVGYYNKIIKNEDFINNEVDYILSIINDKEDLKIGFESYLSKYSKQVIEGNEVYIKYRNNELKHNPKPYYFKIYNEDDLSERLVLKDNLNLNTSFGFDGTYSGFTSDNVPMYIDRKLNIDEETGEIGRTYNGGASQFLKSDITKKLVDFKNGTAEVFKKTDMNLNNFIYLFIDKVSDPSEALFDDDKTTGWYSIPTIILCKWVSDGKFDRYRAETKKIFTDYFTKVNNNLFNNDYLGYWSEYTSLYDDFIKNKTENNINRIINCNLFKELFKPSFIQLNDINTFDERSLFGNYDTNLGNVNFDANTTKYLDTLFAKLRETSKTRRIDRNNGAGGYDSSIEHLDLKTQLYYTFKTFVDRWIINPPEGIERMFDNESYLTVDRGFNDIGNDVVLDLAPLYEMEYNADTSLYTLLLNLLSKNNFEFFALPSFIGYAENGFWGNNNIDDIFGIQPIGEPPASPKFIAMYIGGTSSFLDVENESGYRDDSGFADTVIGLENTQIFRVDIGGGNQSFFTSVDLDQMEYKETNESIRLLDDLTRKSENPTTRAGNSLMNVYEQRSYTATVTMMGCMMIQPTMYFELTMPLFKGTYLILEVNHIIERNTIMTKFKGVRIPRVAKPYVNQSAIGFNTELNNSGGYSNGSVSPRGNDGTIGLGAVQLNVNNKIKAFLDVISYAEGTMTVGNNDGYDVLSYGKIIPNWNESTPHPYINMEGNNVKAVGRYQDSKENWIEYFNKIGQNPLSAPFSRVNQDAVAYNQHLKVGWNAYKLDMNKINKTNFVNYTDAIARYYASIPFYNSINAKFLPKDSPMNNGYNWTPGQSFWSMEGKNGERVSQLPRGDKNNINKLWEIFSASLDVYNGVTANLSRLSNEQKKNVASLHPKFQPIVADFIYKVQTSTNYDVIITSSYRSPSQQSVLLDNNSLAGTTSLHTFGLAFDCNLYNRKTKETIVMGRDKVSRMNNKIKWIGTGVVGIAEKMGMYWGGNFSNFDLVHFEMCDKNGERISTAKLTEMLKSQNLSMNNVQKLDLSRLV